MRYGLVLEGGGMRGMFTAGILDVFMEEGIVFDSAVGVSAGVIFGSNYKSRQPGRALRYNVKYSKDPRYCGLKSWITTGDIFGAQFCYHYLPTKLDRFDVESFQKNPMKFYAVTTDVMTGKAVYHELKRGDYYDMEWMRASASLPLVSNIVKIGNRKMLDGGVVDSIPIRFSESIGCDKNIVILTQPKGFVKKQGKSLFFMKLTMKQKYPRLVRAMARRPEVYNQTLRYIEERERINAAFVIRPPRKLEIGRIEKDPQKLRQVYNLGRNEAKRLLPEIRRFLGQ